MISFIKRNICTISGVAMMILAGTAGHAFAIDDLMQSAQTKAALTFKAVKQIVFVVGGFGLVALAFMAIFGKLDWKKFSALAVGLAILAAAGAIVDYATGDGNIGSQLSDSFGTK